MQGSLFGNKNLHNNDEMIKLSFQILKSDKKILVFTFFSILLNITILGLILYQNDWFINFSFNKFNDLKIFTPFLIIYLLIATFINNYFNTAIIACVKKKLSTGNSNLNEGLIVAFKKFNEKQVYLKKITCFLFSCRCLFRIYSINCILKKAQLLSAIHQIIPTSFS